MSNKVPSKTVNGRTYYKHEKCEGCGCFLVSQRSWNRLPEGARADLLEAGFRKQAVGPYCGLKACQDERARKEGAK